MAMTVAVAVAMAMAMAIAVAVAVVPYLRVEGQCVEKSLVVVAVRRDAWQK